MYHSKIKSTMKTITKKIIVGFFVSGLVYACAMAVYYHFYKGEAFDVWRFLLNFSIFGFFMSLTTLYKYKKQLRSTQKKDKSKQ